MFDTIIHLPWDMFPAPAAVGVEYLAALAGKGMLYAFALFLVVWGLDAATEALRPRCGASRRGRAVFFALSSLLFIAVVVGLFHLWAWPRFPVIRWASQGTKNLSLPEVGIVMLAAGLLSAIVWNVESGKWKVKSAALSTSHFPLSTTREAAPLSTNREAAPLSTRREAATFHFPLFTILPLLAAAIFCWRQYGVFPPRVRTYALAWRECIALFALEAACLAALARPVWRGGWRAWKRYVPRVAWLVALGFWLHGVGSVWEVPRLVRISAGEACGGVESGKCKVESAPLSTTSAHSADALSTFHFPLSTTSTSSLQEAVDAAPDGAVVEVPAGTYGPICTYGRDITLRAMDGPERTVIDAGPLRAEGITNRCATLAPPRLVARLERLVVRVQRAHVLQLPILLPKMGEGRGPEPPPPGGASRLVGFTLRGGHADCGGGAFGGTLEDCVLEGNLAEFCGAGAFGTRLVRCTVRGNHAGWMGGGVWGGSTEGCSVTDNFAGDFGGGVWGGVHAELSATSNVARHHPDAAATAASGVESGK